MEGERAARCGRLVLLLGVRERGVLNWYRMDFLLLWISARIGWLAKEFRVYVLHLVLEGSVSTL